jgi:hypothetical protein
MRALTLFAFLMFWMTGFANSANLYPYQVIYKGQKLLSDDGRYQLIMQDDGNLVYYRTADWSVRWAAYTQNPAGNLAVMQGDGNFVVYNASWNAAWHTETNGHSGAFIAAQNDGNLVIYQNNQPLWHIGADIPVVEDPKYQADAVGRNMENNMPYSSLGHIGLYDGTGGVYEVLNDGAANAVAFNTLDNFKRRAYNGYWGGASPKIPDFYGIGCFNDYCGPNGFQTVKGKWGMVLRAFQILTIGAKYTHLTPSTSALARTPNSSAQQGLYRCDTYLLDIYKALYLNPSDANGYHINVLAPEHAAINRWFTFTSGYLQLPITPRTIFDKLKSYAG